MNTNGQTTQSSVEHVIGYAFPGSSLAAQLGCGSTGCFTVQAAGKTTPAKTFLEAKGVVSRLGSTPGRWSWDHPSNSHLVRQHSDAGCMGVQVIAA